MLALCCSIFFLSLASVAGGCSFIFDFEECASTQDCVEFDNPEEGDFFVCSNSNKCVLEIERECRTSEDCAGADGGPVCEVDAGLCVAE